MDARSLGGVDFPGLEGCGAESSPSALSLGFFILMSTSQPRRAGIRRFPKDFSL